MVSVPTFLLLGLLLSVAGVALEDGDLIGLSQPIANGTPTAEWPSVAALLDTVEGAHSCSGTVIGPKTILTAAHCVCDGESAQDCDQDSSLVPAPDALAVFIPNAGFFEVQSVHYSPDYGEGESDIAIVKLKEAVRGVAPMPINNTSAPAAGAQGTIAGFGLSGEDNADTGIKRHGGVTLVDCGAEAGPNELCWNFSGVGSSGSNTCPGDSGGPLFMDFGQGPVVAGVTSRGVSDCDGSNDLSIDTSVYYHRQWIQSIAGADLGNNTCSNSQPCVGSGQVDVFTVVQTLGGQGNRSHGVNVPADTTSLRVSVSGVDDADFDLSVSNSNTLGGGCEAEEGGQFDTCVVNNPAAGNWSVNVEAFAGAGTYQVIATTFRSSGGPGPDPGESCSAGPTTLCLPGTDSTTQFEVVLNLNDSRAPQAQGQAISLSSLGIASGGVFWIFGADNPEVLVKVLNTCSISPNYWVFYSAGTNLGFELVVRDTVGGTTKRYTNSSGTLAPPVADTMAIPCT